MVSDGEEELERMGGVRTSFHTAGPAEEAGMTYSSAASRVGRSIAMPA
jgi:hypothetical protein